MVTTESLKVSNNGNDKAFYKWVKESQSENLF